VPFLRLTFTSTLMLGMLLASSGTARAQASHRVAQGETASRTALVAERQHVRGELEKANAEIDALKRSGRGLRDDYRLRERLADAESLARRLTELDARLGGGASTKTSEPAAEPRVSPADGPAELDAKADILADQAQRLATRGDALLGRARDLRARQTLRRRMGQMERDPFSPLEGSKRRAMTGSLAVGGAAPVAGGAKQPVITPTGGSSNDSVGGSTTPATTTVNPAPAGPQLGAGTGSTSPPVGGAALPTAQVPGAASTPVVASAPGSAVSSPSSAPAPTSSTDATALSVQLRDLLDPTTLAEIQHLEAAGGGATTSFEALERAGAALKARAERLRQQAATLRASEHPAPRAR
jgi:hypothetical protein